MNKVAVITGVTGQTGSYLAEYLLSLGYDVHGMVRRLSTTNHERIAHLLNGRYKFTLWQGDLCDQSSLVSLLDKTRPHEVYNLAAQSFVPTSWVMPGLTADVTGLGVLKMLEAIKTVDKGIKFYQASSSEMFGKVREEPQNELTPFHPRSPYGVAKVYGHYLTMNYRESYGMFACSGICYNHESPRRGLEFVTRKVTDAVARIVCGSSDKLTLGNLDAKRDWGYAGDYVVAMHLMLQQSVPDDYVVATGEMHSVRELVDLAFSHVGLKADDHVMVDEKLFRPAEVATLLGDPSKIMKLGWKPKVSFKQLVSMMVDADVCRHRQLPSWASGHLSDSLV